MERENEKNSDLGSRFVSCRQREFSDVEISRRSRESEKLREFRKIEYSTRRRILRKCIFSRNPSRATNRFRHNIFIHSHLTFTPTLHHRSHFTPSCLENTFPAARNPSRAFYVFFRFFPSLPMIDSVMKIKINDVSGRTAQR